MGGHKKSQSGVSRQSFKPHQMDGIKKLLTGDGPEEEAERKVPELRPQGSFCAERKTGAGSFQVQIYKT